MLGYAKHWTAVGLGMSTIALCAALLLRQPLLLTAALLGFVFIGMRYGTPRLIAQGQALARWRRQAEGTRLSDDLSASSAESVEPEGADELVAEILRRRRYALIVRPQLAHSLQPQHVEAARNALDESMALVPQGQVSLTAADFPWQADDKGNESGEQVVWVDPLFLDRQPVSNAAFQSFVDDGGYEQMELWATEIWPALLDFVDRTDMPGPRFWRDSHYPESLGEHPVVGVCWYEAAAYARWVGKRLPTDAEWVKAGCWPAQLADQEIVQRAYPWGQSMERQRAHLWSAESAGPVPVIEYADGVSVGGIHQLIGNVWEWTSSNFGSADVHLVTDGEQQRGHGSRLKSLRGGAFDTYFDNQATCHFQSGDQSIARKHNVGFRCALSMCDVVGHEPAPHLDDEIEADEVPRGEILAAESGEARS